MSKELRRIAHRFFPKFDTGHDKGSSSFTRALTMLAILDKYSESVEKSLLFESMWKLRMLSSLHIWVQLAGQARKFSNIELWETQRFRAEGNQKTLFISTHFIWWPEYFWHVVCKKVSRPGLFWLIVSEADRQRDRRNPWKGGIECHWSTCPSRRETAICAISRIPRNTEDCVLLRFLLGQFTSVRSLRRMTALNIQNFIDLGQPTSEVASPAQNYVSTVFSVSRFDYTDTADTVSELTHRPVTHCS